MRRLVLAFETSCDDTSVALLNEECFVVGMKSENQDMIHSAHGGVIPELACRNHTLRILPLLEDLFSDTEASWDDVAGIAVTSKPGLVGSLLVGVTTAKTLAYLHDLPLIGINHLEGHLHAPLLKSHDYAPPVDFDYPFIGLCVSGGHTSLYHVKALGKYKLLGRTVDDAAGEAFDKFGKILGLGYPAGHLIDKLSRMPGAKNDRFKFPRALMKKGNLDFSFSGLKTAGSLAIQKLRNEGDGIELSQSVKQDLAASYQEAIVEVLVEKLARAVKNTGCGRCVVTGGVSANSRLREAARGWGQKEGVEILIPPLKFCTDNAAMIGYVGVKRLARGETSSLSLSPESFMKISELA